MRAHMQTINHETITNQLSSDKGYRYVPCYYGYTYKVLAKITN